MDKFPKDDTIYRFLWNFLSEIVCAGSSGDTVKENLQNLISVISSRQFSQSTCFQTPNVLSDHLESCMKTCNTDNLTFEEVPTTSTITSESIASSLFNGIDFSKAMYLIGLSRYQTDSLK